MQNVSIVYGGFKNMFLGAQNGPRMELGASLDDEARRVIWGPPTFIIFGE